jgi:hypothetical protein
VTTRRRLARAGQALSDSLASLLGASRKLVGSLTGNPGIFSTLQREHAETSLLLRRLQWARGHRRRDLFLKLRSELLAQASAEQATLYGRLGEQPRALEVVSDRIEEHQNIRQILEELTILDAQSKRWNEALKRLAATFEEHVAKEEGDVFDAARRAIPRAQYSLLDREFKTQKAAALDRFETKPVVRVPRLRVYSGSRR